MNHNVCDFQIKQQIEELEILRSEVKALRRVADAVDNMDHSHMWNCDINIKQASDWCNCGLKEVLMTAAEARKLRGEA